MIPVHLPPAALDAGAAEYQRIRRDADNVSGREAVMRIVGALRGAGVVVIPPAQGLPLEEWPAEDKAALLKALEMTHADAVLRAAARTPAGFDPEATRNAR